MGVTSIENRSKLRNVLTWVTCAAMIAVVGWTASSCLQQDEPEPRELTNAEATRLAKVPQTNANSDPAAMSVTFDDSHGGGAHGHVDWKRQLASVATTPEGTSKPAQLVQAVPGLIATHDADTESDPATPPAEGWTVRTSSASEDSDAETDPATQVLDITLSVVLSLANDETADISGLKQQSVWLKEANIDGATVDVFRAPLNLGIAGQEGGGEAIFWVDRDATLRRIQLDPASTGLTSVDFLLEKDSVDALEPVSVLGGGPNDPRDLTESEVSALSTLRQRNANTAAEVDMELPLGNDEVIRARGYLDWRVPLVYLALDAPGEKNDGLLLALPGGAATKKMTVDGSLPPIDAPDDDWSHQDWSQRTESESTSTIDAMLMKLLMLRSPNVDDYESIKKHGAWLRQDTLGDTKTNVVEFPFDSNNDDHEPGQAPYRYWIDDENTLLRVEMNTRGFGLAHTDINVHEPPTLTLPQNVTSTLLP